MKAVIFDMDGVLIDSEPFWKEAEIKAFKKVGYDFTAAMCNQTKGMRVDEVVKYWYDQLKWDNLSQEEVVELILENIEHLILTKGVEKDGVTKLLKLLNSANIPIGLASSSPNRIIQATLKRLKIKDYFQVVHSAENEPFGKPHPAVYISAAKELGVEPTNCVVIEDSKYGAISALAAKMKVIAIPEFENEDWTVIADRTITSLEELEVNQLTSSF